MLTERNRPTDAPLDGRYASEAFELFLRNVERERTQPSEYQAKLFGGANMFNQATSGKMDVGARNIDFGVKLLASRQIALVACPIV